MRKYTKSIGVPLTDDDYDFIDVYAIAQKIHKADLARNIIHEWIEKIKKENEDLAE